MDRIEHWDGVYTSKRPDRVSWYTPRLERSLEMIRAVTDPSSEIIDIGGGASTLVDDLLELGYSKLSVLDVSNAALAIAKRRLGERAGTIRWITGDVTEARLPDRGYDVWHDRAVYHFLTDAADRSAYSEIASKNVKPGGHLIIATFALEGPTRCSGLEVVRYGAESLGREIDEGFTLEDEAAETHVTPTGAEQRFLYCSFRRL